MSLIGIPSPSPVHQPTISSSELEEAGGERAVRHDVIISIKEQEVRGTCADGKGKVGGSAAI